MEPWRRNFLAVWPSLFVVSAGLLAFVPTLPLYLRDRFGIVAEDEVRLWSGLAFGAAPLAAAITGPIWGALGDRHGRKPMALRAIFGVAAVTWAMPLASTPLMLVILRFVQGLLAGYVAPAMALVSADTPAARQGVVIGRLQIAIAVGLLFGPVLGAEIAIALGREAVFRVTSVMAFVAAVPVWFGGVEDRAALAERRQRDPTGMFAAMAGFLREPLVGSLLVTFFLARFAVQMIETFVALWVEELGPPSWVVAATPTAAVDRTTGIAFSMLAIAQILFTGFWGRRGDRHGPLRCMVVLTTGLGAVLLVTAFVPAIEGFLALRALAAVFLAGLMPLAYAALAKRVDPARRSLGFACLQSGMQLGMCGGPLLGGVVSAAFGIEGLFVTAAVVLFWAATWMARLRNR